MLPKLCPRKVVSHVNLNFRTDLRFKQQNNCCICKTKKGISVGCRYSQNCPVSFHIECARRAKYYINLVGDKDTDELPASLQYREHTHIQAHGAICGNQFDPLSNSGQKLQIFCLRHRPFELPQEMKRRRQVNKKDLLSFVRKFEQAKKVYEDGHWNTEAINYVWKMVAAVLRYEVATVVIVHKAGD